jgi:hypothetical protein
MGRFLKTSKLTGVLLLASGLMVGVARAIQNTTAIAAGDSLAGTLTSDVNSSNYDLTPGDKPVMVAATSAEFTPTLGLALANSSGGGFSVSFDGNVGNPFFIPPLSQGQSVQIQVGSRVIGEGGAFTLSVTPVDASPIHAGESIDGTIDADGTPQYFSFQGELGKLVTITAAGGSFDTRLKWYAPGSAKSSAADNDGGVGYDPEIYQAVLTASGTSYIEVMPAFTGESGSFKLALTVSDPPGLQENSPTPLRLGGGRGTGVLTFAGMTGGKAQVSIASMGGDTEGAKIWIYQDGVQLSLLDRFDPEKSPSVFQMDTKTDNPVYVFIIANTSFGEPNEGQFEVTLTRL